MASEGPLDLSKIQKVRNCVPFITPDAGCTETMAAIDDLIAEVTRLRAVEAELRGQYEARNASNSPEVPRE